MTTLMVTRVRSADFQNKSNPRLTAVNNQIKRFGSFLTNTNESTKDHANLTNPDGTALADLRALIYGQPHISSKLLDGSYSERKSTELSMPVSYDR